MRQSWDEQHAPGRYAVGIIDGVFIRNRPPHAWVLILFGGNAAERVATLHGPRLRNI